MDKKYSIRDKKKLMYNIKEINDKELYYNIYEIIKDENIDFTSNCNGVFFDFNKINNNKLLEIENVVLNYNLENEEEDSIEFIKYSTEEFDSINSKGSRLNNIEKQFLKYNKLN
tara:strand:+ start:164 stop:505 length:342 start_codon:yes stop_codon:yes gene_type:complete